MRSIIIATILAIVLCPCISNAETYYIAANGDDMNNGTSKLSPLLHAPGMPGCSDTCAGITPTGGDYFIFRGGDTWHRNTGSPIGSPWAWSWSGASNENRITIGTDETWFSGDSWSRPIIDGDNALSVNPVESCQYGSHGSYVTITGSYVTFENFEFRGMCNASGKTAFRFTYITLGDTTTYNTLYNIYIHGWSRTTSYGYDDNQSSGMVGIKGTSHQANGVGTEFDTILIDGNDSPSDTFFGVYGNCYNVHNSVFRYVANGVVCNNVHIFNNNIFEHIANDADDDNASHAAHSNGFEFNSEGSWGSPNLIYNNIIRYNSAAVKAWVKPNTDTSYYFNNVTYGNSNTSNCWAVDQGIGSVGYFFNNTWVDSAPSGGSPPVAYYQNNLYINSSFSYSPISDLDSISLTTEEALLRGYSELTAYNPTGGNCNGLDMCPINIGSDLSSYSIIQLNSDILGNSRGASWDIGAYEYVPTHSTNTAPIGGNLK